MMLLSFGMNTFNSLKFHICAFMTDNLQYV